MQQNDASYMMRKHKNETYLICGCLDMASIITIIEMNKTINNRNNKRLLFQFMEFICQANCISNISTSKRNIPTKRATYIPLSSVAGVFTCQPYGNRYINNFSYLSSIP